MLSAPMMGKHMH